MQTGSPGQLFHEYSATDNNAFDNRCPIAWAEVLQLV